MDTVGRPPAQRRGRSKQDYGTPREFLYAVERRFGSIEMDLAAHAGNAVVPKYLGPGSNIAEDALAPDVIWSRHDCRPTGLLWLNPPFADIYPWAEKCAQEGSRGARIALLAPYSLADWYEDHVHQKALVLKLKPRMTFVGAVDPYPKDLILAMYGPWVAPGETIWRWNAGSSRPVE